jgi:hypothetical protein
MESISRAIDKLPTWTKVFFYTFIVLGSIYYIAHYGFLSFLMHVIFSP